MATRFKGDVSLILWMAAIFGPLIGVGVLVYYGVKWVFGYFG
jgi:hypothetical protein